MTITTGKVILNEERNVSLVTMIQDVGHELNVGKRPAIIVLPGGGYSMCSDREAEVVAYPYLAAGYHAFVLRYSVGIHRNWPNPLDDWEQAMEYILAHADEWGLAKNKIAVIGFSAGGHLAATAATMAQHRPNAALLGYAALLLDIAQACQPGTDIPAPVDYVDGKTPPCFLFSARDDSAVPTRNQVAFLQKLVDNDIVFECHVYPRGGHGFSTAESQLVGKNPGRLSHWVPDSIGFLEDIFGVLTPKGLEEPVLSGKVNGDREDFLSLSCSLGHLRKNHEAEPIISPIIAVVENHLLSSYKDQDLARRIFDTFVFREILLFLQVPPEEQAKMNAVLQKIPNINK